jgi:hypothetical protein
LGSAFLCADLELHQESRARRTPLILRRGWRFSRATTAPFLRQPRMPNVPPITSTRKPPRKSISALAQRVRVPAAWCPFGMCESRDAS